MKRILIFASLVLLQLFPNVLAHADNIDLPEGVVVNSHEAVFEVHGLVCSFCAVGVQKKLSKLPFIDASKYKKGVYVEIEKQKVTVAIKSNEKLNVKMAYKAIRSGGYEPIKVMVADKNGKIITYNEIGE